jgi:hypothetical protein
VRSHVRLDRRSSNGDAAERLVRLVLESHDGTALVPIPERSTNP